MHCGDGASLSLLGGYCVVGFPQLGIAYAHFPLAASQIRSYAGLEAWSGRTVGKVASWAATKIGFGDPNLSCGGEGSGHCPSYWNDCIRLDASFEPCLWLRRPRFDCMQAWVPVAFDLQVFLLGFPQACCLIGLESGLGLGASDEPGKMHER